MRIGESQGADFKKLFALVRKHFNTEPETLDDEKFAQLSAEALWLTDYEAQRMELSVIKAIAFILAGK